MANVAGVTNGKARNGRAKSEEPAEESAEYLEALQKEGVELEDTPAPAKGRRGKSVAKSSEEKELKIKPLNLKVMSVDAVCMDDSSLIVHAWSEKAKRELLERQMKNARMKKEAKVPVDDFNGARYVVEADDYSPLVTEICKKYGVKEVDCVPSAAFRNALISSARFLEGVAMTTLRGSIFVVGGEFLPILDRKTGKPCEPHMRQDMVRVGGKAGPGSGVADIRFRPEYLNWKIPLKLQFNANVLSDEQVVNLLHVAGFSVGICEWRPEKSGDHGRFTVGEVRGITG